MANLDSEAGRAELQQAMASEAGRAELILMFQELQRMVSSLKQELYLHNNSAKEYRISLARKTFQHYAACHLSFTDLDTPIWILYEEYYVHVQSPTEGREHCCWSNLKPLEEEEFESLWAEHCLLL